MNKDYNKIDETIEYDINTNEGTRKPSLLKRIANQDTWFQKIIIGGFFVLLIVGVPLGIIGDIAIDKYYSHRVKNTKPIMMNKDYKDMLEPLTRNPKWESFMVSSGDGIITEFTGELIDNGSDILVQFESYNSKVDMTAWSIDGEFKNLNLFNIAIALLNNPTEEDISDEGEYVYTSNDYIEEDSSYDEYNEETEQEYYYVEPTVYMWSDGMDINPSKMNDFSYLKKHVEEAVFSNYTSKSFGEVINDKYNDISISLHQGPEGYPIGLVEGRLKTKDNIQISIHVSIQDGYLGISNISIYDWDSTQKVPNDVTDVYKYLIDNVFPKNY